jgi:site-specific DNA recombinase
MTKVAAIYARVSSDRQKENHTIASQVAALRDYAQAHEYKVPAEWCFQDEGYSGATLLRPGLEALRDLAAGGHLEAVLIYSPDRLSRKYAYQVLLAEELSRCGVELVFLKAPSGATPEDQLLLQFQGMIAEYERAQIAERSRRGKRHRAHQGSISVLSGAPYGYRYVRKSDTAAAYYEVLEAEAAVVRRVYETYTQERLSINAIAHRLNEEQIPTRTGTSRWERSTVWGMLRNPAYQGRACYGKTELRPRQRITRPLRKRQGLASRNSANHERPRPDWIEMAVPALVSEATFALAQEQLESNKHHSPRRTIEPSLLQGMLVCERCGYSLYRTSTQTSARKLYYYRCLGSDAYRHLQGAVCDNPPGSPGPPRCGGLEGTGAPAGGSERDSRGTEPSAESSTEGRPAKAARGVVRAGTGPAGKEHGPPAECLSRRFAEPGATSRSDAGTPQTTASSSSRTAIAASGRH